MKHKPMSRAEMKKHIEQLQDEGLADIVIIERLVTETRMSRDEVTQLIKEVPTSLGPIAEAIRNFKREAPQSLYLIFSEPYMHEQYSVEEFRGTFLELLRHLDNISTYELPVYMPYKVINGEDTWFVEAQKTFPDAVYGFNSKDDKCFVDPQGNRVAEWDGSRGILLKPYGEFTTEELIDIFNYANGDGQAYQVVYSLDEHRIVLGENTPASESKKTA